ncbi:MAG: hypothetical protein JNK58_00705 [Phycisphaerae bacterium]|nr:hypothetical protein [Phycisphaerae bacterium]
MPIQSTRRAGKALKKFLIGVVSLIVVLVAAVVVLLPPIAASFIAGSHEVELPSGKGTVKLEDVSIAWGGPQKIGKVTLADAQGKAMANLTGEARTSLLGAVFGGGNIGTVLVSGTIDVTEEQLTAAPGAAPAPPAPSGTRAGAKPTAVPRGLRATLEAKPIHVTYTPRAGSGLSPVTIDGLEFVAMVSGTGEATMTVGAKSPTIDVKGSAKNFVNSSGELALSGAEGDLDATLSAPGEFVEAIARLVLKQAAAPGSTSGGAAPTELSAHLKVAGGRLRLADPAKPVMAKGPVPQAMIEMLAGEGAAVALQSSPSVTKTISVLDLPLPDASGKVDLRGASLRAMVTTTPITGTVSLDGAGAKPFRVEPVEFEVASTDFAQTVTMKARTRGSFDGNDAGSLELDAEAQGLLDDTGMVRGGLPGRIGGQLKLKGMPTRLAETFVKDQGFSLVDVIGPSIDADVNVRTVEGTDDAGSPRSIPPAHLTATVAAAHLNAALAADVDERRLRLDGEGFTLRASRLLPAIRAYTRDQNLKFSGDGRLSIVARDVTVPLMSGGLPDLGRLACVVGLNVSGLVIEEGAGDRPLEVKSLDTTLTLAGDASPKLAMKHELSSGGRPFSASGAFDLPGLITKRDTGWPFVEFTPAKLRPSGSLEVKGLPSDLLGYVPSEMRESAERALGPDINIKLDGKRDESGKTDLALALSGQGIEAGGAFTLDDRSVRSVGDGFRATVKQPGPLVQSFLQRQPNSPVAGVNWNSPLTLTIGNFSAALPAKGEPFAAESVETSVRVKSEGIGMDVRASGGDKVERITAENLDAGFVLTKAEGAAVKLDSRGSYGGEAFTVAGDLSLGKVLGAKGVDLGALMPKGKIEALGVPTALIAAFDAANGPIVREAAGERLDVSLLAPAPSGGEGAASGARSAGLALKGSNINANSSFSLAEKTVNLGQTTIAMTMTPGLVRAAVEQYAAEMQPRPALQNQARVNLTVFPVSVDLTPENKPDMKTLRPVRGMLTSPDDVVLMNLPGGSDGRAINAGLRGVEAGFTWNEQDVLKREGSLKAKVFEPSEPSAVIAIVEASGLLTNPPSTFDVKVAQIDTARADRMLNRPGLLADLLGEAAGVGATGRARSGVHDVEVVVKSSRVNTTLALQNTRESIRLTAPGVVDLDVPAAWANRYVFPPNADGSPASMQLADAVKLNMRLNRFAMAHGETPLKPGVFAVEAVATSPMIRLRTADGQAVDVQSLSANITSNDAKRSVAFDVNTKQVGIGGAGGTNPVRAVGEVMNLADDSGRLAMETATVTARVTGTMPTAVLDALGNQKGMLVDLLGAMTKVEFNANGLSKQSGTLSADVETDNARAGIRGSVRDATFITEGPTKITLSRITPELSKRYFETTIPIISRVEKTREDEPATVDAMGLTVPSDSDTRKINGTAQVDLGTLRFNTSSFFGELLKLAGGKDSGQVGRRIKPFEFVAREGVVSYERIELPLGEFTIWTRGKVDLNTRKMDVVTFVPFSALADELAGVVRSVPGIEALTMIPIRTHGSFDNPKSEVQLDLLVKESLPGALDKVIPEDIKKVIPPEIGEGLKDLFKKKEKKKD